MIKLFIRIKIIVLGNGTRLLKTCDTHRNQTLTLLSERKTVDNFVD